MIRRKSVFIVIIVCEVIKLAESYDFSANMDYSALHNVSDQTDPYQLEYLNYLNHNNLSASVQRRSHGNVYSGVSFQFLF